MFTSSHTHILCLYILFLVFFRWRIKRVGLSVEIEPVFSQLMRLTVYSLTETAELHTIMSALSVGKCSIS